MNVKALNSRLTRLAVAYLIGLNALAGLVLGIALGVVAGLRTDKALKGFFQD